MYGHFPSEHKDIKPQPSFYGDTVFRSRLEARWAIFFDRCGIKWDYKPKLFRLKNGMYYLPDFLLHDLTGRIRGNLYVEVKGVFSDYGGLTEKDSNKIWGFINPDNEGRPERPLFVLCDIFSRAKIRDTEKYFCHGTYFDLACYYGSEEREFFQFMTLDGDNWTAIPGVNKEGKAEIFSPDGSSSYYDWCDMEKTEQAYRSARDAVFDFDGKFIFSHTR